MDAWGTMGDLILFGVLVALALVGSLVMLWRERQPAIKPLRFDQLPPDHPARREAAKQEALLRLPEDDAEDDDDDWFETCPIEEILGESPDMTLIDSKGGEPAFLDPFAHYPLDVPPKDEQQ